MKTGRKPKAVAVRFWLKVVKTRGGCWLFTSAKGSSRSRRSKSYGYLSVPKGEEYLAHRISWIIHNGPIPTGIKVLHICDTPRCVNPKHLFLGTSADNMEDMKLKGRSLKGEKSPMAKLTESQVQDMRKLYRSGKYSQGMLADLFAVSQTNVSKIVRGRTWS